MQADSLPAEPQGKPKNTGVCSLSLLQQIFPTQELNRCLLHCRQILYQLSYKEVHMSLLGLRKYYKIQICCSVTKLCPTLRDPMDYSISGSTICWSLLKFMSTDSVMLSNHLILCHPLFLLHSVFPNIWVFPKELALYIRWPKVPIKFFLKKEVLHIHNGMFSSVAQLCLILCDAMD